MSMVIDTATKWNVIMQAGDIFEDIAPTHVYWQTISTDIHMNYAVLGIIINMVQIGGILFNWWIYECCTRYNLCIFHQPML